MPDPASGLGAREREILEIVYRLQEATPAEVRMRIPEELSDSTVRTMLRHLEKKKLLKRRRLNGRWVYHPVKSAEQVRGPATAHLVDTFFGGSPAALVSTLLQTSGHRLTDAELQRLSKLVDDARSNVRTR